MAKNPKDPKPAAATFSVKAEDLNKFVNEAMRQQQSASEYASSAGGYIKGQIERLNLNPKAVKQVIKKHGLEPNKRLAQWRDEIEYGVLMGHFDEVDMFDDFRKVVQALYDRVCGDGAPGASDKKGKEPDPAVTQFN